MLISLPGINTDFWKFTIKKITNKNKKLNK